MVSMFVCVACTSSHACRRSGHYLVGFEKDVVNYAISSPLHNSTPSPLIDGLQSSNTVTEDDKEHV